MKQLLEFDAVAGGGSSLDLGVLAQNLLRQLELSGEQDREGGALLRQAHAAVSQAQARLAQQRERIAFLEGLTNTDELTGLLNRRGFLEQLRRVLSRAARYGDNGVLIFCDLDDFKSVNDAHGHAAGDTLLRHAGEVLRGGVRDVDIVARLGGDEFAIILVQTSWRDGARRGRTVETQLNRASVSYDGTVIPIRASVGMEPYGPADSPEDLISRADMAMYCDKRRKCHGLVTRAAE